MSRCVSRSGQTDLAHWNSIKESVVYVINVIKRKGSNEKKSLNYIYIGDLLDVDCILLIRGC